ncbi:MAG: hypothetical protein CME62_13005 [Halobacteriovoraceae bacterium]|nr:hypothetical protein [Halobacteriovoraceae bacterium]|tara:strand:+ start:2345 stop:2833 length:489 start_codon:yes stop_codon:yes gene_type:complete
MNSEGNGRLVVNGRKYVFGYDSLMDREQHKWSLELDFPLHPTEIFEIDWSENKEFKFNSSIDQKILRENKNIDPMELDKFTEVIVHYLQDLVQLQNQNENKLNFNWTIKKNTLYATNKNQSAQLSFNALDAEGYFKKMVIGYQSKKNQSYKMEFVVRKCFNK